MIKNKNHNCKTAKEEQETKAELTSSLCADGKEYGVAKGEEGAKQGQWEGVEMEAGISAGSEKEEWFVPTGKGLQAPHPQRLLSENEGKIRKVQIKLVGGFHICRLKQLQTG